MIPLQLANHSQLPLRKWYLQTSAHPLPRNVDNEGEGIQLNDTDVNLEYNMTTLISG